ncbi:MULTISPECIES: flagellar hook-associated protein 2 [Brevibacillus]|jgi:flagellar hook-associated protein 2|uniref:Flagellar hook-associated protein 2 n=1 Tax=Brevibacillus aydinogluensis TaxID=927786 RepID=A0AA48M4J0_9BACL|nr:MULTISPECIES: flagellar hook-associated protein 2 [Brevibacillus]MBR8661455.1 flagellar hook-associated protein 2 [Brevibacillus sp. NL20B1]CAJ1001123.1 flagellar hook-associated protein 2 [Brevibacillus aydinogluensis]
MISPIRLGGIASGLDTDKIVRDLMKVEREPLNRLKRKKQLEEWKRDSYREMNALLLELQKSLDNLRFASNLNKKKAVSNNDAAVSVTTKGTPSLSSYTIKVTQLAQPAVPPSAALSVDSSITDSKTQIGSDFSFSISTSKGSSATITVSSTDTIDSIIARVNQTGTGVKASFLNNKLVFTSSDGSTFDINVSGDGTVLGMGPDGTTTNSTAGQPGTPGIVEINGVTHSITSNTFTYDGMEINLKQVTTDPIVISVRTDEDAVFSIIKSFVDKYNEVIEKINNKISEKKYKGYEPLLDEEKQELPEKTAEKLENMAKSGILLRDSILSSGLDAMRFALSNKLEGADSAFDTLSEIGITGSPYGKYAYMEKGKLYIDETKLRKAISENGEKVINLFTQYSSTKNYNETGLAQRLYDEIGKTIKLLTDKAGSSTNPVDDSVIGRSIDSINRDINLWEDRLQKIEDRYWKRFTAMESALAKMQSQSTWFMNLFGGQQ